MLRILLITYDTSPYRGSEAAVSWNFITQMSRHVQLSVIYGHGKEEVETYLGKCTRIPNTTWYNVPTKSVDGMNKIREFICFQKYYRDWHKKVLALASELTDREHYDAVHFLNLIGFKEPGFCWKIRNTPYIWGPIQAVENRPLRLTYSLSKKYFIKSLLRRIIHNGWFRYAPIVRKAMRHSDAILAATPATVRQLKRYYGITAEYLPENGIVEQEQTNPIHYDGLEPLRLIWVGSVIERKALRLTLLSLRKIKSLNWHLDVVGDGPELSSLKELFSDIEEKITYHGKVSRKEACDLFSKAHLHIISSMGEASTTVLFEAISKGVPTLSLDHCGMSGIITHDSGIKVALGNLKDTTDNIASRIAEITRNPQIIGQLSTGTIACGQTHSWNHRCEVFIETYNRAMSAKGQQKTQ